MPDKLPKGWVTTRYREVTRHHSGAGSMIKGKLHDSPGEERIPAYSASGQDVWADESTGEGDAIIVSAVGARCGKAFLASGKWAAIANTHVVWPETIGVNATFLWYRLNDEHFWERGGTAQPFVLIRKSLEREFDMPPLAEQERIVAKLETLLSRVAAGEAAARRALERLKRYRAAVLHAAVTGELTRDWRKANKPEETGAQLLNRLLQERRTRWEAAELKRLLAAGKPPKDNKWKKRYPEPQLSRTSGLAGPPRGWVWTSVDQLATGEPGAIQSGPFGSQLLHSEFVTRGILAIGIDNVLDGVFSMGREHRITSKKYERLKKFTAQPRDVVITVMATVGRVCVLPEKLETAIITKHCYRISPPAQFVDSRYLAFTLRADAATRHHIFGNVRGQTRAGINGGILKVAPVPLPSLDEQREIVREVERRLAAADRLTITLNRQLGRARATRQSLLRDAFNGKLVSQDLKDEPASVLLDRIRAARQTETTKPKAKRMPKPKVKAVETLEQLEGLVHTLGKAATPERLFLATRLGDNVDAIEKFFDLLRAARDKGNLVVPVGKATAIRRVQHAN